MIDVGITVTGSRGIDNGSETLMLSNYKSDESGTAWQKLRSAAIALFKTKFKFGVFNVMLLAVPDRDERLSNDIQQVNLILNITATTPERLNDIEYFRSFLGDMGSSVAAEPIAIGFIDKHNKTRYEFANGAIFVRDMG